MSKTGRWMVAAGGMLLVAQVFLCHGVEALRAQTKSERAAPTYQYVGVDQTLARVDISTGKIDILARPGEPRASLLTKGSKPWEWMEVPVRAERQADDGKAEPADRPSGNPKSAADEPGVQDK
jgi:hypothetical protein